MSFPKISVIMGIYNCASTIDDAVNCIINQSLKDWELILCDDGSTDNTYLIAEQLAAAESRIKLIRNEKNCGLNYTLNHCLSVASGEYIARMDGDDLCSAERFKIQADFLDQHPQFDIVSSAMAMFDENGEWGKVVNPEYPTPEQVVTGSPICHAPVMLRKVAIDAVGGYTVDKRLLRVEDVNLWIKLYANGSRCYNIQQALYSMRNDQNALHRRKYKYRINSTYARIQGCKMLHLSPVNYIKAVKPMIVGLCPAQIRHFLRKKLGS